MPLLGNVEKVAAILLRQKVVSPEQSREIVSVFEQPLSRHRKRGSRDLARKKSRKEEVYAPAFIAGLQLTGLDGKTVDEECVIKAIAKEYGIPYMKIDPLDLDQEIATSTIPKPFALKHTILPIKKSGNDLTVAIADPEEAASIAQQVAAATGCKVSPVISSRSDLEKLLAQFFAFKTTMSLAENELSGLKPQLGNLEQLSNIQSEDEISASDLHIQNAVSFLFNYALQNRASDIHIEPKRDHTAIRMRIDGALVETQKMPRVVHAAVVSRIKILARMDIAEKRRPQDGRIKALKGGKESEMRVSSLPVAFGEKMVIRIFDAEIAMKGLETLGFFPDDLKRYKSFLDNRHGIILVTGQTGSGKTSTLYATLKELYTPEINIVTIEDPIEMVIPELNQVAVQPAIDFTFANALRSILRQDPDIIMVGEIRDAETAQNAVQAALTGHLVLSTLHTNDTASTLARLYEIGVEPYLLKSTLIGVVSQKLVRVICENCKTQAVYPPGELKALGIAESGTLKKGQGCEKCRSTGYLGRTGVHEVMEITDALKNMMDRKTTDAVIKQKAREEGMRTLRENALQKAMNGTTTIEEVVSVLGEGRE
jgi:general secretion pathway protein E